MKKILKFIPLGAAVLLLAVTGLFCAAVLRAGLLPGLWTALLFAGLFLLDGLLIFLCARTEKKGRLITGLVLALLFVLGLCFGTVVLNKTVKALRRITETAPEFSRACVYVRTEDEAQSIEDLSGDIFGVLPPGLLNDTEEALSQINEGLGLSVQTREYAGLGDLLDALLTGEIRCVILNPELLAIAGELGAYDMLDEQLRIITELHIQTPDEPLPSPAPETEETEDHCFSVYVSGIDTFGDVSVKSRSDVNIIVSVNTLTHQILMITTPRDYYVPLPISNGERDKLTHAGIYGIDVSKGALEMLYDTQIDYYFRVNFTGFEKIIDAIGGIDAELEGYPGTTLNQAVDIFNGVGGGRKITVPVITWIFVLLLCAFNTFIMKTRLGQKFRAVGQNRTVANSSGINVDRTRVIAIMISTVLAGWGQILFMQSDGIGTFQTYAAHEQVGLYAGAAILVGGASIDRATNLQALIGTFLFHSLFITAQSAASNMFGDAAVGEYFRAFLSYGVIALALVLYAWRGAQQRKANNLRLEADNKEKVSKKK